MMMRTAIVTIPDGYKTVEEFAEDCGVQIVKSLGPSYQEALDVLRLHHKWHLEIGTVLFPDETGEGHHGSPVEVDLTEGYCDSTLYEKTVGVMRHLEQAING